jgi:hypothetical protein
MRRRITHYSSDLVDARFSVVEHLGNDPVATAPSSVLRVLIAVSLFLLLNACTSSDPASELEKETKTIISWAATAQMVSEAWRVASVPQAYADRTFQSAQEEIEKQKRAIQKLSVSSDTRGKLIGNIESVGNTIAQMQSALRSGDRAALASYSGQLGSETQELERFVKERIGQRL